MTRSWHPGWAWISSHRVAAGAEFQLWLGERGSADGPRWQVWGTGIARNVDLSFHHEGVARDFMEQVVDDFCRRGRPGAATWRQDASSFVLDPSARQEFIDVVCVTARSRE